MNEGIYALQKKRQQRSMPMMDKPMPEEGGESAESPVPESMSLEDYWDKIMSIDAKLDQVLEALGNKPEAEVSLPKPPVEVVA